MKRDVVVAFWAEVGAFVQAAAVVAISIACLLSFLKYRAAYPFPLGSLEGLTPPVVTPSTAGQTPQSILLVPPMTVPHEQVAPVQVPSVPPSPPEDSKRNPRDLVTTPSLPGAGANPAAEALTEAEKLFEDGHYAEALARCNAALSMDPGNAKAKQLKEKIEKAIEILGR
jgi:hypothetical protein